MSVAIPKKPVVDPRGRLHESMSDAIRAAMEAGCETNAEIAQWTGLDRVRVGALCKKFTTPKTHLNFAVHGLAAEGLKAEANKRGLTVHKLARKLIVETINSGLVDAVLDDGVTS